MNSVSKRMATSALSTVTSSSLSCVIREKRVDQLDPPFLGEGVQR
jgi:hypothetical protein